MLRTLFLLPALLLSSFFCSAQNAGVNLSGGEESVLYKNEMTGGIMIHTSGLGLNFRRGKHITGSKKGVLEIEALNMRHPKEVKTVNPYFDNSKGFYFGKLNSLLLLRGGLGYQKVLYGKAERKSLEIRYCTFLGASLGFAKPVYLEILHETNRPFEFELSIERYNPEVHEIGNIYGRASYFKGIEQTRIYPGGYAKLGLSFEYADIHDDVKAIETGIAFDVYPKVLPLMAFTRNNQVFVSLYLHLLYGKKWY